MGVALFGVITLLTTLVQQASILVTLYDRTPELQGRSFDWNVVADPGYTEKLAALANDGDAVAKATLYGGIAGIVLVLFTVRLWKRKNFAPFLGMRSTSWKQSLIWTGVFLLLISATEVIARLFPAFQTDFVSKLLGSTTDFLPLFLGVGLLTPIYEELLMRGLLLGSLRHIADEHTAVALSAGVFAVMHLQYPWTVLVLILPLAIVLGYARVRSGSIWLPMLLHVLNNVAAIALS